MPEATASAPRALTRQQAESLVDAVMEHEDLALTASAYEDAATGEWVFEATSDRPPDLDAFAGIARSALSGDVTFSAETIDPNVNWVAKSLEGLKPVTAGRFYVHGSHDTAPPPAGATAIRIDAAQAFGTGHHETTAGCLEALDRLMRRRRFVRPLDIGTGTGVLAIAIARRQRRPVLATDIDPVAAKTAAANAQDNGVGRLVSTVVADGLGHLDIRRRTPFDLIVANILAAPLIQLAPAVARAAAPHAAVVLSGLLASQSLRVQLAYMRQGLMLRRRIVRGDWATLVLERI